MPLSKLIGAGAEDRRPASSASLMTNEKAAPLKASHPVGGHPRQVAIGRGRRLRAPMPEAMRRPFHPASRNPIFSPFSAPKRPFPVSAPSPKAGIPPLAL